MATLQMWEGSSFFDRAGLEKKGCQEWGDKQCRENKVRASISIAWELPEIDQFLHIK